MNRIWSCMLAVLVLAIPAAGTALGQSSPVIQGRVQGVEVAPQSLVGKAVFVGSFAGRVGWLPFTVGAFYVGVQHEDLPASLGTSAITGGDWALGVLGGSFAGDVNRGTIYGDGYSGIPNVYPVVIELGLTAGGTGEMYFVGVLDHRPLFQSPPRPPRVQGNIVQTLPPP